MRDPALVTGWCMEPHDVVLAKCAAGRERDWEFAREAIRAGIVGASELLCRVAAAVTDGRRLDGDGLVEAVVRELRDGRPFRHLKPVTEPAAAA